MGENPHGFLDVSRLDLGGDVEEQFSNLLAHVRLSRDEVIGLRNLLSDLERALMTVWPNCEVQPFGSIVTGLGIRSSDFDVFVKIPHLPLNRLNPVMLARNILRNMPWIFTNVFAIPQAKVPIVKFYHTPTGCNCDVNFKSESGVRNSKLIYSLLQTDSRALNLAIIVKYWSKVFQITGTNLLANYALTMLVVFYLQGVNMLATVAHMQETVPPLIIDNWNTAFDKDTKHPNQTEGSLYTLLGGFFKYYSVFRFDTQVVSTYIGVPLPKSTFAGSEQDLPQEYSLYKENLRLNICKPLRTDTPMCIQDPFDHSRNCSVAVSPKLFHKIMFHFRHAASMYDQMDKNYFLKAVFTISNTTRPMGQQRKTTNTQKNSITPSFKSKGKKKNKKMNNIAKKYTEMHKNLKKHNKVCTNSLTLNGQ